MCWFHVLVRATFGRARPGEGPGAPKQFALGHSLVGGQQRSVGRTGSMWWCLVLVRATWNRARPGELPGDHTNFAVGRATPRRFRRNSSRARTRTRAQKRDSAQVF